MPLIAYNLTAAPLVLAAGNPVPTLKASASVGARGQGTDVTIEMLGLTAANYAALQAQQAAGSVQYEWTNLPEYGTFTLVAGSAQKEIAENDLSFFADATLGNDNNPGTQALPVQTVDKLLSLIPIGGWRKSCLLFMAPGTYPWNTVNGWANAFHGSGTQCSPPVLIGAYSPLVAGLFSALTDNPLSAVATTVNVASTAGFPISGTVKIDSEFIGYTGVIGTSFTGCTRGISGSTAASHLVGASVFQASYAVTAVNADGSVNVAGITAQTSGVGVGADAFTFATPAVTLSVAAGGFVAAGVKPGMSVTIAGATTPANNGTFLITAVTATTLVFTNLAGVAEPYAGAYSVIVDRFYGTPRFTVVSGPGAGSTRMCAGNTATALVPNVPFAGVAIGSIVQLEVPAVTITLNQNWIHPIMQAGYKGITFKSAAGAGFIITEAGIAYFEGCVMDFTVGAALTLPRSSSRLNGTNAGPWTALGVNNPFSGLRNNGLFIDGLQAVSNGVNIFDGANWLGNHLLRNVDVGCNTNAFISISAHGRNSSITCADASTFSLSGTSAAARAKFSGNRAGTPWIFGIFDNSALVRATNVDLTNCIGNPVQVGADTTAPAGTFYGRGGAKANLGDVAGSVGNTGVGVKYTKGSYVVIDAVAGAAVTSVTGVGGDTQGRVVAVDTKTYAAVRTPDLNGVKGWPDTLATTINNMNRIEPPV